jgi:hypothetical protein
LSKTVYLAGPHHALHNLQERFADVLLCWEWYIERLKHVCRLLSNKWSKNRLLRHCFTDGPAKIYYPAVAAYNSLIHDKRWGTAAAAVSNLMPIKDGLIAGFSKAAYAAGSGTQNDGGERACNLDVASEAIGSNLFWGYSFMQELFAWVILALSHWYDGCPCHDKFDAVEAFQQRRRGNQYYSRISKCALAGRRAIDFASGDLQRVVSSLLEIACNALLVELAAMNLSAAEIARVMRDYTIGRRHFWLTNVIKHSYWNQLPWQFFGIAHPDVGIARACAVRCLQLAQTLTETDGIHWLTFVLLFTRIG